ncbi:MAG: chemotaxis protein CheR, partial [Pseudomonadota bacterium]
MSNAAQQKPGTIEFTDAHFNSIRQLVTSSIGVQLPDMKRQLAYSRFAKRMRSIGVDNFDDYIKLLSDPSSGEMDVLPSIITTNVTSFLREGHHFEYL